jgi:hypothetical protein
MAEVAGVEVADGPGGGGIVADGPGGGGIVAQGETEAGGIEMEAG